MEKLVYLLHCPGEESGAELRTALRSQAVPALRKAGASRITLAVNDEDVSENQVAIVKSEPPIRAMVSFWMENADDRAACESALRTHAQQLAGYLVVESRPQLHEPPVGTRAPGVSLVTRIHKLPDLPYEDFIRIWNDDHKIVAVETQSTFAYVRNAVVRRLTPEGVDCEGIVEESFPIGALTDPKVFYDCSSDEELKQRLGRMMESVNRFLDLKPLESTPMSEYFLD